MPRFVASLILVWGVLLCGACGGEDPADQQPAGRYPAGCALQEIDLQAQRLPVPFPGLCWGQEIWVTYKSEGHEDFGFRSSRSRPEALDLARRLCSAVRGGADIGALARKWSNGRGGVAKGFCVVPHPSHRSDLDVRDVALITAEVGELTPLIEWQGGFWFARRVQATQGEALGRILIRERGKRARARVIHLHHREAFPRRHQFDKTTEKHALDKAWRLIRKIQQGADFSEVARKHSNDTKTRARGGLLDTTDPISGKATDWVSWGDRKFSQPLLDVILEKGAVGKLWPEPVVSGQGIDVVLVLERIVKTRK